MKKILQTLTRVFFAVLLLSFGTANAQTVHFDDAGDPNKATSITGLTVNDISYDVTFIVGQEAFHIYGDYPGTFTFTTSDDAEAAVVAMDAALNAANAAEVGINEISGVESFYVPWTSYLDGLDLENIGFWYGSIQFDPTWVPNDGIAYYPVDARNWTVFTATGGTTGLNEELSGVSISVFPNPAENYIHIETEAYIKSIYMSDITGKVMKHLQFEEGESITLDVSEFDAGVYFLKLEDDKGRVSVKKILIQ